MNTQLKQLIEKEEQRQQNTLGMIPSENYTSKAVREAVGSVLMHKYSEGLPGARYYEGNDVIDEIENAAREQVKKVMLKHDSDKVVENWHSNVQTLSGSIANLCVYNSILNPGDKILSMYLPDGGHLSHGWSYTPKEKIKKRKDNSKNAETKVENQMFYEGGQRKVSIVSKIYNVVQYKTDPATNLFDYDFIEQLAKKEKPKLIITGGTAYPRDFDYGRIRKIADGVEAYYLADVAHEAGLIAGGALASPFQFADFVTFTTHKTLRGPRGAVAMCRKDFADKLDKSVMPGIQGGPFNHNIAGVLQALYEADTDEFANYARQVVANAKLLAQGLAENGFEVITGGTDKHLVLVNLTSKNIGGTHFAKALALAGIITNKNTVPYEKGSPLNPSGIRFGTPLITTRGMKEVQISQIIEMINAVYEVTLPFAQKSLDVLITKLSTNPEIIRMRLEVEKLCQEFPLV